MTKRSGVAIASIFFAGFVVGQVVPHATPIAQAPGPNRVFEIRTYTAPEGKLEELHARFRNHRLGIFQKHNMTSIAYFRP